MPFGGAELTNLKKALNLFNAALVTPTYYVYFTSSTIVASAVLFQGFNGTATEIITVVMGFLVICSGVVLLQLSKSAKDVPDTAVLNSDLDQIRTVGEQEQAESEPKADAIRGTAALIRRLSTVRQKWEADEARRVYEDKLRDQMEPISENEQVEWDGLRRRKTVLGPQASISRRKTIHPPLGMAAFPELETDTKDPIPMSPPAVDSKRGPFGSQRRTSTSRVVVQPFSNKANSASPVALHDGTTGSGRLASSPGEGESMEMKHVFGLPSGLRSESETSSRRSPGNPTGKPIMWASDVDDPPRPKKHISIIPPSPRSMAKRQFSFQNMFHRGRDGQEDSRTNDQHLKVTEEERIGLTRGDSNTSSSEEGSPVDPRRSLSDNDLPSGLRPLQPDRQGSNSDPGLRSPGGGRALPPVPSEEDEDEQGDADFEKNTKELESYRRPGNDGKRGGQAFL